MSPAAHLWIRIFLSTAAAVSLALLLAPPRPEVRLAWPLAIAVGAIAGILLFAGASRRWPRLRGGSSSVPVLLAKAGVFGLWATNEEVVWRRVVLGELLGAGAVPAFAASTVGFALMHRTRRGLHLCTGGAFGALYLLTGVLAASVVAHWAYNLMIGALVDREPRRTEVPP